MPERDLAMDTLKGVLEGKILVQNHCYRADEMAQMIDMSKEFGYHIAAFHHAVEAYKIADLLRDNDICAAMWADWYGFKMEAYDAIKENIPLVHNAGRLRDRPLRRPQRHPAPEPGGGQGAGRRPPRRASTSPTRSPGNGSAATRRRRSASSTRRARCAPGKMADVVLWNGNPFSDLHAARAGLDRRRADVRHERSQAAARSATSSSASRAKET